MALKIIGAGGPRTGTASLKSALEIIGYGKCYHMEGLFNNPDEVKYWHELFETGSTDFETLFNGYQSSVDFPGYMVYKDLLKQYPEAKVILTLRDGDDWYESIQNTAYAVTPKTISQKLSMMKKMLFSARFRKMAKVFKLLKKYLWKTQYKGNFPNKAETLAIYNRFNEEVREFLPKEQLLEFKISEGWEPLCKFLDVPVPNVPFPHKNKRKEFKEQIGKMMSSGQQLEIK